MSFLWAWLGCGLQSMDSGEINCERTPPLTYDNFGKGHLDKHCVGCHSSLVAVEQRMGAPITVDFNTYELTLEWVDRIIARATGDSPTMPPGGGPSETELAHFQEWMECNVVGEGGVTP